MRNLFNFIIRNSHWLLAILLIAFSFYLLFSHNSYQRSVYLTSANNISGWFYRTSNNITSFVHLKKTNQELLEKNAEMQNEINTLKTHIAGLSDSVAVEFRAFSSDSLNQSQFNYIPAEVVNMSFSGVNNFITLNKGSSDGIKPDMGVVSQNGVVGVVSNVSSRFSVVIPIINPMFRLSAKPVNSDNHGSVSWNGDNAREAQLGELPKQQIFQKGDTIETSFSRIFPKHLIIGYVSDIGYSGNDNFQTFNIQLATDFYSLNSVYVIEDRLFDEQKELEETLER